VHARMLVFVAGLMLWLSASAQEHPPFCMSPLLSGPGGTSGHLEVSPASPNADQPVTITAGRHVFIPSDISADVADHVVNVYVTGHPDEFTTPAGDMCLMLFLTRLDRGNWTVNAYSIDSTQPGSPPQLFLSESLTVTGGAQQPVGAPSASAGALGALGLLLALAAFVALRSRGRRSASE
jgi:hypothetical protein